MATKERSSSNNNKPNTLQRFLGGVSNSFSEIPRLETSNSSSSLSSSSHASSVTEKCSGRSKCRRVSSFLDESLQSHTSSTSSAPTQGARRSIALTNIIPCENQEPVQIDYPDGLPRILFGGELLSDDADKVVQATIQLKAQLRSASSGKKREEQARQFVALGGHALLVTVMRKWETHAVIQYRLLASVADFTYHYPNSQHPPPLNVFAALVQMGALELVVGAMSRFAAVENFQYTGMLVVGNLCTDGVSSRHAERFVRRLEGIPLICAVLRRFPKNETIQQTGTWLLEVLCALGWSKAPEMKGEALATVALAVQAFPDNTDLTKDARSFMKKVVK